MITRFERGKWYKWIGPLFRQEYFNDEGKMDFVFKQEGPFKCIKASIKVVREAMFEGDPSSRQWYWSLEDWEEAYLETECPHCKMKVVPDILGLCPWCTYLLKK